MSPENPYLRAYKKGASSKNELKKQATDAKVKLDKIKADRDKGGGKDNNQGGGKDNGGKGKP